MNMVRTGVLLSMLGCCAAAWTQETLQHEHATPAQGVPDVDATPTAHVPPAPPSHEMPAMSAAEMASIMAMDDAASFGKLSLNEAEWTDAEAFAWDLDAWYGNDRDKVWIKSDGALPDARDDHFSVETLWDHAFARWWSVQAGVRYDDFAADSRTSLVLAVQGLAPQWFEVEASLYVGEQGAVTLHTEVDYDLLLTQRLILQPTLELRASGENDAARGVGSGLSEAEFSLRLRYELRREAAPYIGIRWLRRFGNTADLARAGGEDERDTQVLAGIRVWF